MIRALFGGAGLRDDSSLFLFFFPPFLRPPLPVLIYSTKKDPTFSSSTLIKGGNILNWCNPEMRIRFSVFKPLLHPSQLNHWVSTPLKSLFTTFPSLFVFSCWVETFDVTCHFSAWQGGRCVTPSNPLNKQSLWVLIVCRVIASNPTSKRKSCNLHHYWMTYHIG